MSNSTERRRDDVSASGEQIPIQEGLFTWPSNDPRLLGSKCADCGAVTFPQAKSCPKCCGEEVAPHELHAKGTLWSWTIQGFPPKSPPYKGPETVETFLPFGVGYVHLGEVIVETRLSSADPERLVIGMDVALRIVPFRREGAKTLMTYEFAPQGEPA